MMPHLYVERLLTPAKKLVAAQFVILMAVYPAIGEAWDVQISNAPSPHSSLAKLPDFTHTSEPANAQAFWKLLLTLIDRPGSYVEKGDFENVFGVRLNVTKKVSPTWLIYGRKFGANNRFAVGLDQITDGNPESQLRLDWDTVVFGDNTKGECIHYVKAVDDIVKRGWIFSGGDRTHLEFDVYSKNGQRLQLNLAGPCVIGVALSGQYY